MKTMILKDLKLKDYLPKSIIKNYNLIINGKNYAIDADIQ